MRKQKTDRLDARRLARELSVADRDPLPEAWFPPRDIRELRLRARQRCWLAVLRALGKNRVQSLLQMHGLRSPASDLLGAAGRAWLGQQTLPAAARESVEQILRLHDFLSQELEISKAYLRAVEVALPELRRLRTIPGIGEILAPVIWSEMGRLERFASADAWGVG